MVKLDLMAGDKPDVKCGVRADSRMYTVRNHRRRFFYPKEWMRFYDNLKPMQKLTMMFLLHTGARINEARGVKIGDIDFANRRIILRNTKVKAKKGERNPQPRIIPISTQFVRYLKAELKNRNLTNDDYVEIMSTPGANLAMKKALKRAEIKDWYMFSIHNIRKTLEVWLLALNIDSLKLTAHLGHDIRTAAQHYISPDIFSFQEKQEMRLILGDLYANR